MRKLFFVLFFTFSVIVPLPVQAQVEADINNDNIVDLSDYSLLIQKFSTNHVVCPSSWSAADFNSDCIVDLTDYSILIKDFFNTGT